MQSAAKALEAIDPPPAVGAIPHFEKIREGENADPVDITRLHVIDHANELIGADRFAAAAIGVHAVEIEGTALDRAHGRRAAPAFDVGSDRGGPGWRAPEDLVIGHDL